MLKWTKRKYSKYSVDKEINDYHDHRFKRIKSMANDNKENVIPKEPTPIACVCDQTVEEDVHQNSFKFVHPFSMSSPASSKSPTSSQMGDITLEHMIDAMIESAKKISRTPRHKRNSPRSRPPISRKKLISCLSPPSYMQADDPANDLFTNDLNVEPELQSLINEETFIIQNCREEREIIEPTLTSIIRSDSFDDPNRCFLRRQRAIRRKNNLNKCKPYERTELIGLTLPYGLPSPEVAEANRLKQLPFTNTTDDFTIVVDCEQLRTTRHYDGKFR